MKSTPIIYSAPMVLARLAGRKTNTRRLVKLRDGTLPQEDDIARHFDESFHHFMDFSKAMPYWQPLPCPYGQPGDELWTRETFHITFADYSLSHGGGRDRIFLIGRYLADNAPFDITLTREETAKFEKWKRQEGTFPAIYMFRSLCRDTATITAIHPQPLQDITEADALAEGMSAEVLEGFFQLEELAPFATAYVLTPDSIPRLIYRFVWDKINAKRARWATNPWVWSIHTTPHA